MWEKGENLIIRKNLASPSYRFMLIAAGAGVLFLSFCIYKIVVAFNSSSSSLGNGNEIYHFAIGIVIGCVCLYFTYFSDKKGIIIGKEGIKIEKEGISYPWDKVTEAYFGAEDVTPEQEEIEEFQRRMHYVNYARKKKQSKWYLHVLYSDEGKIVHDMHDLSRYLYDSDEITKAIEYWSGRDNAVEEDCEEEKRIGQPEKEEPAKEEEKIPERIATVMQLFKDAKDMATFIFGLVLILLFIIIPLLVRFLLSGCDHSLLKEPFPSYTVDLFIIGVPILLSMRMGLKVLISEREDVKQSEEAKALSQEEYEECSRISKIFSPITLTIINILLLFLTVIFLCAVFYMYIHKII